MNKNASLNLENAVTVEFPLRGEWTALSTPSEKVPSHGTEYFGQKYAFDFGRFIGPYKSPYRKRFWHHLIGSLKPEDCYAWGEPILAPFNGVVIGMGDGWPDRKWLNIVWDVLRVSLFAADASPEDYRPLTGNYILLEGTAGVALLAHLLCGSIRVALGQRVSAGESLGAVGYSGNTTLPHLHFHIMDHPDPFRAQGVLCKFRSYERLRNGMWEQVNDAVPDLFESLRVL